ncbi:MAG: aldolase, partial [Acidobacteria bacterium]|nr:aldolase [Acidobacteriota bacterium]
MTPDPLGYREALLFEQRFFPLGFPLVLRTNSKEVVDAARESWGEFEAAFEIPAIELRVVVRGDEAEATRALPEGPVFRAQGNLLALVLGTDNFAVCDLERGFGFAMLSPGVARNGLFASFHFLDAMAYLCLCHRYLAPIHGACVARDGKGILLVGGPGAGKSSLAWACARAGLTFVSDDATWLLRREPVLLGRAQRMRFRPEALTLLPDLAAAPRIETVIGKHSFEIRTADVPNLATAARCRPGKVVFLNRQASGPAECRPIS